MADERDTGVSDTSQTEGAPGAPSAPPSAPPPSPPSSPPAPTPGVSGDGQGAGASTGASATPAPQPISWLENLRKSGVDLGPDEASAVQKITQYHKDVNQLRPLSPYLSIYQQYAPQFHDWLKQQAPAGARQAPPKEGDPWWKGIWNPPEYNQSWEQYITVDPTTGKHGFSQETPPEIIAKYQTYRQFRAEQAEKIMSNPPQYFEPMIDRRATEIAKKIVAEQLGQMQQKQSAGEFINQNRNWLYELDQTGAPRVGQTLNPMTGQYVQTPVLSQWGQKFYQYAQDRRAWQEQRGISDEDDMKTYAQALVERDYAIALYQSGQRQPAPGSPPPGAPQKTPQELANEAFLASSNPAAAMPRTNGSHRPAPQKIDDRNFRETMLKRLGSVE